MSKRKTKKPITSSIWVTNDGEMLRVSEMDTRHIINSMRLMERRAEPFPAGMAFDIYNEMEKEIERRLAEDKKKPVESAIKVPISSPAGRAFLAD